MSVADERRGEPQWTRWLPLATGVALAIAAVMLRRVEVDAEFDYYHERAEQLLAGNVVFDKWHPFGYVLLITAVHAFVADSLIAGCLVSAAAAALLVWATGEIAGALRAGAAPVARLFAATNAVVWMNGTMAASDMTAAACTTTALAMLLRAGTTPAALRPLGIGVWLGLAVATRFPAGVQAAVTAVWVLAVSPRMRTGIVLTAGLAIGFLPQIVLGTIAAGSPLHNDAWHNVVLKVVCKGDHDHLGRLEQEGMPTPVEIWRDHGGEALALGAEDSAVAFVHVLPAAMLGTREPIAWLGVCLLLAALAGLVWPGGRRGAGLTLIAIAALVTFVSSVTFWPNARILLPVLPLLLAGLSVALRSLDRWRVAGVAAAVVCAASIALGVPDYRRFVAAQPIREAETLRNLPHLVDGPFVTLSMLFNARRYVPGVVFRYAARPSASPEQTWQGIRESMDSCGARVFVAGHISNPDLHAHVANASLPADFRRLVADADVAVVESTTPTTTWFASFAVTPGEASAGAPLRATLTLSAAADAAVIGKAYAVMRDPTGRQTLLDLAPTGERTYQLAFPAPGEAGEWQIAPFVLCNDRRVHRGAPERFAVSR